MNIQYLALATVLVSGVALGRPAPMPENGEQTPPQANMPMMGRSQQGQMPMGYPQRNSMNPMMRMYQQGNTMPMRGNPRSMARQGGDHMSNSPMMRMMYERHTEMQAHRQTMEKHMARIETLLQELVNLQKEKQ